MALVTEEQLKIRKESKAVIREYNSQGQPEEGTGFWGGPWLLKSDGTPILYTERDECWRKNIAENNRRICESKGLNHWGQTPEQVKAMEEERKELEKISKKAKLAAEMTEQAKGGR